MANACVTSRWPGLFVRYCFIALMVLAPSVVGVALRDHLVFGNGLQARLYECATVAMFFSACAINGWLAFRFANNNRAIMPEYRDRAAAGFEAVLTTGPALVVAVCILALAGFVRGDAIPAAIYLWIACLALIVPFDAAFLFDAKSIVVGMSVLTPWAFAVMHPLYMSMRPGRRWSAYVVAILNLLILILFAFGVAKFREN
jgi:hypothetical protein